MLVFFIQNNYKVAIILKYIWSCIWNIFSFFIWQVIISFCGYFSIKAWELVCFISHVIIEFIKINFNVVFNNYNKIALKFRKTSYKKGDFEKF